MADRAHRSTTLHRLVIALTTILGGSTAGCEALESARPQADTPPSAEPPHQVPPARAPTATNDESSWPPAVLTAIHRGIGLPGAGDGTYLIDPFVAALVYDELATHGHRHARPVTATPSRPAGYELHDLESHPLLSRLGLRNGDIVVELDGQRLDGVDDPGRLVATAARRIKLKVFRDDHAFVLVYRLQPALAWHGIVGSPSGPGAWRDQQDATTAPIDPALPPPDPPTPMEPEDAVVPSAGSASSETSPGKTKPKAKPKPKPKPNGDAKPPPNPGSDKPGASPGNPDVHCSSPGHCTITRTAFSQLTASPERTKRQYGIVPAVRNDVHSGYKVKKVPAGSHLAAMGFRPDDKVTHINEIFVADDAQAIRLISMVQSSKSFRVRYERRGVARVKTIVVR